MPAPKEPESAQSPVERLEPWYPWSVGRTEDKPEATGQGGAAPKDPKKGDILGAKLMELDWTDRRAAIEHILEEVRHKASSSEEWYRVKKDSKAQWAILLRVTAILCGILSGLWPVLFNALAVMYPVGQGASPGAFDFRTVLPLSAVFVIVAAGCLSLDTFFGFSSGWIRYVVTFQSLQTLRETFELAWPRAALRFPREGDIPDDILLGALDVLLTFTKSVNDTIRDETQAWAADFREALKGMGEAIEKQRMAAMAYSTIAERGAVTVTVDGASQLDDHTWTLTISGQEPVKVQGASTEVVERLSPGLITVRVAAKRGGKPVAAAAATTIEAGKSASVTLCPG